MTVSQCWIKSQCVEGKGLCGGCAWVGGEQKVPGRWVECLAVAKSIHHTDLHHQLRKWVHSWRPVGWEHLISRQPKLSIATSKGFRSPVVFYLLLEATCLSGAPVVGGIGIWDLPMGQLAAMALLLQRCHLCARQRCLLPPSNASLSTPLYCTIQTLQKCQSGSSKRDEQQGSSHSCCKSPFFLPRQKSDCFHTASRVAVIIILFYSFLFCPFKIALCLPIWTHSWCI